MCQGKSGQELRKSLGMARLVQEPEEEVSSKKIIHLI